MLGNVHAVSLANIELLADDIKSGQRTFSDAVDVLMRIYSGPSYHLLEINRGDFEFELDLALRAPDTLDFPPRLAIKAITVSYYE